MGHTECLIVSTVYLHTTGIENLRVTEYKIYRILKYQDT